MKLSGALALASVSDAFKIDQPQHGAQVGTASTKPMFCYYTNWSQYRPDSGQFFPEDIPSNLCTHLFFSFAYVENTSNGWGLVPFEWNDMDESWMDGLYTRMNNLKSQNPSLKTLIAIGGWNHGNIPWTEAVSTPQGVRDLSMNSLQFAKDNGFDGVDLDWEYPAKCTIDCSVGDDYDHFKDLYVQLRNDIDNHPAFNGMMLTAAVGIGIDKIYETEGAVGGPFGEITPPSYDVPHLSAHVDWINLMTYDMHGHWEDKTMHQAPAHAYSDDDRYDTQSTNFEWIITNWLALGADPKKLALGLPAFGRSFKLADPNNHGILAPCEGPNDNGLYSGEKGPYTREPGYLAYYEICEKLDNGWTEVWNDEIKAPYAYGDGDWVGYDNERSIRYKVNMAKDYGLGAIMWWAVDIDDFKGQFCHAGPYPLLNAAKDEWNTSGSGTHTTQSPNTSSPNSTPSSTQSSTESPTPTQSTQAPTTSATLPNNGCNNGALYPHASSCQKYYQCANNVLFENSCGAGLYFDTNASNCNWEAAVDCCNGQRPCGN